MAKIIIQSSDRELTHTINVSTDVLENPLGVELLRQEIEEKVEDILLSEV